MDIFKKVHFIKGVQQLEDPKQISMGGSRQENEAVSPQIGK